VSSADPLCVYVWTEPYVRLAGEEYDNNSVFSTFTNNSIQKKSPDYDGNMISFQDLVNEL
jgi:hypothetical protein